ncbi:MAG: type IIA DNA topoisomerase subunit B [Ignavibacteria bacterium]|nr:type IIA DNA topoisomerase subunit B [Ignavibacteria bacterium]
MEENINNPIDFNNSAVAQEEEYNEGSIRVLEGLEAVRMRPAMYIGDTGERGLHHLINEVVDNSIDEALAGYCKYIIVTLHTDGSCSVQDDGRGIPTGMHPTEKKSTLEVVLTTLHAGGKFDRSSYKVSGGLHGVGVSCVNALSKHFEARIQRDGKIYQQFYSKGAPVSDVEVIGESETTGTTIRFIPDDTIFHTVEFKYNKVAERLRELAFLNPYVSITLKDESEEQEEVFHYKGGLKDFVAYIDESNRAITKSIFINGRDDQYNTEVDICFEYNDSYSEVTLTYVNNIHTIEGGTHLSGFRAALTRTLKSYAEKNISNSKNKIEIVGEDFREGLTAIISCKVPEPQFEGQTKTKLGNGEVEGIVRTITSEKLVQYLDAHPQDAKQIIEKAIKAAEARIAARKSRDLVRRKNALEASTLPGKLADCSSGNPEECEIYIVEGDSAGGSAKQGRDRKFQAILPLRGKVLNVQKAIPHKILENEEIKTIITAIGAGFNTKPDYNDMDNLLGDSVMITANGKEKDFDADKSRYGKIIIMADADVDGSHIRTLLLTFFFNYMRDLIYKGKLFIACPPLYKVKKGKQEYYAYDEDQRIAILERIRKDNPNIKVTAAEVDDEVVEEGATPPPTETTDVDAKRMNGVVISRFKGLGEMNPEQLWSTTMNPESRTLLQVSIEDAARATMLFQTLMGDKVEPRREFIEKNAKFANLDI